MKLSGKIISHHKCLLVNSHQALLRPCCCKEVFIVSGTIVEDMKVGFGEGKVNLRKLKILQSDLCMLIGSRKCAHCSVPNDNVLHMEKEIFVDDMVIVKNLKRQFYHGHCFIQVHSIFT